MVSTQGTAYKKRVKKVLKTEMVLGKRYVYTETSKGQLSEGKRGDIVQELCENRGGCPGLSILTSLLASMDVKIY